MTLASEQVERIMKAYGFTKRDLARCLNVELGTIYRWLDKTPPAGLSREVLGALDAAISKTTPEHCLKMGQQLKLGIGAFIVSGLRDVARR